MTAAGTAQGYTINASLQAASAANNRYYFVCDKSGTGTSPAPTVTINPPDMILSNGSTYEKLDISNFIAGQVASNIGVTATGGIQNTNVQSVLEELDTEKLNTTGGTLTGNLALNQSSSIIFEGATPNDFESTLTVIDPTADRTLSLPNVTGTLVSTGDTGTVTSTMILDGTILNADINASAAIALTKLANVTAAHIIVGNASNVPTAVAITGDISISNAGLVAITADSIVNADIKSDAAISGSKIVAGTTSVVGVVQLTDSAASSSTTTAATPAAVKVAKDAADAAATTANAALPTSGGTLTNNLIIDNAKQIRFTEADANGANYVSLQAPDTLAADVSYTLPSAAPTANGQVLASTTGGVLSWTEDPTGGWVTSGDNISYSAGDVSFIGASANLKWDKSTDDLIFDDSARAIFGTNSDGLEIFHESNNSYISDTGTGGLVLLSNGTLIETKFGSDVAIKCVKDGAVQIYYDGGATPKLETYADGIKCYNHCRIQGAEGESATLALYADESDDSDDQFLITSTGSALQILGNYDSGWHRYLQVTPNGGVQLYYDVLDSSSPTARFETISTGAKVTGAFSVNELTGTQFPFNIRNDFTPNTERADLGYFGNLTSNNALRIGTVASNGGVTFQGTKFNDSSVKLDLILNPDGGNVGINITSPDKSLTIGGSTPVIKLNDGNSRLVEIRGGSTSYSPSILSMYADNFYIGANGTLMSSFHDDGQIKVKRGNNNTIDIKAVKGSYWGYSTGSYAGVLVGNSGVATNSTIFMGVDTTGNTSGAFTGDGREIVFRNNHSFVIPNAANNGYLNPISLNRGATTEGVAGFRQGCLFGTDTADANILDDYEEGSWTPVLKYKDTSDVWQACTFTDNLDYANGRYVKVGNIVHGWYYTGYCTMGSAANNRPVQIHGLPEPFKNGEPYYGGTFVFTHCDLFGDGTNPMTVNNGYANYSASYFVPMRDSGSNNVNGAYWSTAGHYMMVSFTYQTD